MELVVATSPWCIFNDIQGKILQSCSVLLSTTNNMQRYTIFFVTVNALHVSGGFSAHHQELKNCTHSIWYVPGFLTATASGRRKQGTYQMLYVQFLSS